MALRPAWVYKLFDTSDQMPPSQAPAPPPPGLPSLFLPHSYCLLLMPFCLCVCVCAWPVILENPWKGLSLDAAQ